MQKVTSQGSEFFLVFIWNCHIMYVYSKFILMSSLISTAAEQRGGPAVVQWSDGLATGHHSTALWRQRERRTTTVNNADCSCWRLVSAQLHVEHRNIADWSRLYIVFNRILQAVSNIMDSAAPRLVRHGRQKAVVTAVALLLVVSKHPSSAQPGGCSPEPPATLTNSVPPIQALYQGMFIP